MKKTIHSISLVMVAVLMAMFSLNANAEINFTSDPAEGSKVYSISTISFTFTDMARVHTSSTPTCTITDKDGNIVCSGGTFAKTSTENQIVLTCNSEISTVGEYTITIPKGSLILNGNDEETTETITLHLEVLKLNIVSTIPEEDDYYRADRHDGLFTVTFDQEVTCNGGWVTYPETVDGVKTIDLRHTLVPTANGCSITLDAQSNIKSLIENGSLKGGEPITFALTGVKCKNYPAVTYDGTGDVKITFTLSDDTPVFATSLTLDKNYICLNGYGNVTYMSLTPTITPTNTTNDGYTWTSSDTNVATVDAYGGVRAVGQGIATITATTTDGTHLSASTKIVSNAWLYSTPDVSVTGISVGSMTDGINTVKSISLGSDDKSLTIGENSPATFVDLELTRPIFDYDGNEYQIKVLNKTFQGCTSLKSIQLPNTITTMGNFVFSKCTSLESVNWPTSVTTIGEQTFADCSSLKSLTLPDGLKSIGYMAFLRAGLTSISLPAGLESIGDFGFTDCKSLAGDIDIPSSVRSIGGRAFENNTELTNVNLHSVPSLSDSNGSAFQNYGNNVNIYLTDDSYVLANTTVTPNTVNYTRSVNNQWGTVVLPFSITSNDAVQLYEVESCNVSSTDGELTLKPVTTVAANTPCFFKKLNGNATSVCFTQNSATISMSNENITSSLAASGWTMVGRYDALSDLKDVYYLAQGKLWCAEEAITLPAYRAYLKYTDPSNNCKSLSLQVLDEDGDVDEIVNINPDTSDEGIFYNLAGQRVNSSAKGIVIKNGIKYLRK